MFGILNKVGRSISIAQLYILLILSFFIMGTIKPIGNPLVAIYNWLQRKKVNYNLNRQMNPAVVETGSTGFFTSPVKHTGESFAEGAGNKIINEKLPEGLQKLRDLTKEGAVGSEVLANLTKPIISTTAKIEQLTDKIYKHFKKSIYICIYALFSVIVLWYMLKILTIYIDRRIK